MDTRTKIHDYTAAALAVILVASVAILALLQLPIPDALSGGFVLVLGYFFGVSVGSRTGLNGGDGTTVTARPRNLGS